MLLPIPSEPRLPSSDTGSHLSSRAALQASANLSGGRAGRMNQRHIYIPLDLVVDSKNQPVIKETSRV